MIDVSAILSSIEAEFNRLSASRPYSESPVEGVERPFDMIGQLGLGLAGDFAAPHVRRWAAGMSEVVWDISSALMDYHTTVYDYLVEPWEDASAWPLSCKMWSDGVFFRELFDGTGALEFFPGFSLERDLSGYGLLTFRGEEWADWVEVVIPQGTPERHWWWWLPGRPPSGDHGPPDFE